MARYIGVVSITAAYFTRVISANIYLEHQVKVDGCLPSCLLTASVSRFLAGRVALLKADGTAQGFTACLHRRGRQMNRERRGQRRKIEAPGATC